MAHFLIEKLFHLVHARMLCPCDAALDGASNMWLFDDHLCRNDHNKPSSSRFDLPSSLPIVERVLHASSFFMLLFFSNTQKTYGYAIHKNYKFFYAMIFIHY